MTPNKRKAAALALAAGLVAGFEGLRTVAYRDPVGIPTICFGETRGVRMGDVATAEQCRGMLADRLAEFGAGIAPCLPADIPDESRAAFLSAAYNIGTGAFCASSMSRRALAGDLGGACDALLMWDKAKGIRLPGLTKRRAAEQALCRQGIGRF